MGEERKGRKKAEQSQQEAEDEVATFRDARKKSRISKFSDGGNENEEDDPFAVLLQKARDKNSALEDNIFSYMCSIYFE